MKKAMALYILVGLIAGLFTVRSAMAADFRIAIMQDQAGAAQKYRPLIEYLGKKGSRPRWWRRECGRDENVQFYL